MLNNDIIQKLAYAYNISSLMLTEQAGGLSAKNFFAIADSKEIFIKQYVSLDLKK